MENCYHGNTCHAEQRYRRTDIWSTLLLWGKVWETTVLIISAILSKIENNCTCKAPQTYTHTISRAKLVRWLHPQMALPATFASTWQPSEDQSPNPSSKVGSQNTQVIAISKSSSFRLLKPGMSESCSQIDDVSWKYDTTHDIIMTQCTLQLTQSLHT